MNKYINLIKGVLGHELVSGSFYIFLGTTISSFLAFLVNLYFARDLSYADYGVYSSLLSIITLLTIPAGALAAVIVRYATLFFSKKEDQRAGAFYKKSFKFILIFGFVLNFALIIIYPFISKFLKIDQIGLIILTGISVSVFYFATLNIGFLQSLLKFRLIGLLYLIAGLAKLFSGVLLVFMGWRVYGAILATFFFSLIDFVLSLFPLKKVIKNAGKEVNIGFHEMSSFAAPTTVAIFSMASFISTDVLLVKHFFSPTEAGFYGGLSLVGKVIFYFTGPIPSVMFPLVVKKHANNEKYNHLLYAAIGLVILSSLFITIFYFLFPEFTIKLFLGGAGYLTMAPYLGIFGLFLTIYSINNVFVNFFISIKKTKVSLIALFWAIAQVIFILIFHDNFSHIIYVSIITSLLLLGSLLLYYLRINGFNHSKK